MPSGLSLFIRLGRAGVVEVREIIDSQFSGSLKSLAGFVLIRDTQKGESQVMPGVPILLVSVQGCPQNFDRSLRVTLFVKLNTAVAIFRDAARRLLSIRAGCRNDADGEPEK